MRLALLALFLAVSPCAHSEPPAAATGDYRTDLGQLYAAMMEARLTNDICAEVFPNLAEANDTAYREWRSKNRKFLQEIQEDHAARLWQQARQNPQQHMRLLDQTDDFLTQQKKALRENLARDGREALRAQCTLFPVFLTTERMNLDVFYAQQVKTIRKNTKVK